MTNQNWQASVICDHDRCDWFKLQKRYWAEDGEPTTILIRTDEHPQALLDRRDLGFQGYALDGNKCDDHRRWWDVYPVKAHFHQVNGQGYVDKSIYAFATHDTRNQQKRWFLALFEEGFRLQLLDVNGEIPETAQWQVESCGTAFSPGEVAGAAFVIPVAAASAAVTGGLAGAAVGGAWVTTAAVTGAAVGGGSTADRKSVV